MITTPSAARHLVCLCLLSSAVLTCHCGPGNPGRVPTTSRVVAIAAAANLKFVMKELGTSFQQQYPDMTLRVTYGASGRFFAQISQQAPFDVFLSADAQYPQQLVTDGLAAEDDLFLYATGRIAIWVADPPLRDFENRGIQALGDPSIRKIAIANPQWAPYGVAAEMALSHAGLLTQLGPRLVYGESVTQAAHFVQSGAAQAGIIALSLAKSQPMVQSGSYWVIPESWHDPIDQGGVLPKNGVNRNGAKLFLAFLRGPVGRTILENHGYESNSRLGIHPSDRRRVVEGPDEAETKLENTDSSPANQDHP